MPPKPAAKGQMPAKAAPKALGGSSKQPARPREPLPVPQLLKRLFTALCAQIDGGHLANAVRTCDKILRLAPGDEDATQTKLFLLLQTEQYTAALELVEGDKSSGRQFEQAYALYRLQRESDARAVVEEIKTNDPEDRGVVHLEAQMAYRRDDYEKAVELYTDLFDSAEPDSEEHVDLATNLSAAQRAADFLSSGFLSTLDSLPAATLSSLETAPPPTQPAPSAHLLAAAAAAGPAAPAVAPAADAPRKVRARRVPRGVVPGVTPSPDPERWLKKSERTNLQQRRRGYVKGGATQGVVLDQPAQAQTPATTGGGTGGGKSKAKKRK